MRIIDSNTLYLAKLRFFTVRDLWLFLLGIIFVSMTSGAIGSFILGINENEFFIGGADNILIVSQPGISTPVTGKVPEILKYDIEKIDGVLAISPECLAFTVAQNLNEKSILVRGITPNFSVLTPSEMLEGDWFHPDFGESKELIVNGALVGFILAEDLSIKRGDKLMLASTLVDIVIELTITGIIKTNSPSDEEILVDLSVGKLLTGKGANFVSYHRVLIDDSVTSKNEINEIINSNYTLSVRIFSHNPLYTVNNSIRVVAYTSYGAFVNEMLTDQENKVYFNLKFGTYEFIAYPENDQASSPLEIFLDQDFPESFELMIGGSFYDLGITITYNNNPIDNLSVVLYDSFNPDFSYSSNTNLSGYTHFDSLPESFYTINAEYNGVMNSTVIKLNSTQFYNLKIESSLHLKIINTTSMLEVNGGTVEILETNETIINYESNTPIFLDPDIYTVNFSFNGINRIFHVNIKTKTQEVIYVGTSNVTVNIVDEYNSSFPLMNVSILQNYSLIDQSFSNASGFCEFNLESGLNYTINIVSPDNTSRILSDRFFLSYSLDLKYEFLQNYTIDIFIYNGTSFSPNASGLVGVNITISDQSGNFNYSGISDIFGWHNLTIDRPGFYKIDLEKDIHHYSQFIKIPFRKTTNLQFPLGDTLYIVSTRTLNDLPVSNVSVIIKNASMNLKYRETNSSGLVTFILPDGNYLLQLNKYNFLKVVNITISGSGTILKTIRIEANGNFHVHIINQYSQDVSKVSIFLSNDFYKVEYRGSTDNSGSITFFDVPWSNYTISLSYKGEILPTRVILFCSNFKTLKIQIETSHPLIVIDDYNLSGDVSFSVISSSSYVSGFIESTLVIIVTTMTSLIIIISVLSLLSIASVISHPIVSNERTLTMLSFLGASRNQVIVNIVTQLTTLGFLSSIIGTVIGTLVMVNFPTLRTVNVGGIIITPVMNPIIIILITLSNSIVVFVKAFQKVNEVYTPYKD